MVLPHPPTTLLGREAEIALLQRLVASEHVVTIIGVGGAGETRVAVETAHRSAPGYARGVWFCDLATVGDAKHVASAVAAMEEPGRTLLESSTGQPAPATACSKPCESSESNG